MTDSRHGTRSAYRRGCHCLPCRASNAAYESRRRVRVLDGDAWLLVSSVEVQAYLVGLQGKGVGHRQAAKLSGLSAREVHAILHGRRPQVRQQTAAKLLAVRPVRAFGVLVPAHPTWRLIRLLLKEGYTRKSLAFKLGLSSLRLSAQNESITIATALKVQALYRLLVTDGDEPETSAPAAQELPPVTT